MFLEEKVKCCWHYKNAVFRKSVREIRQKPQKTVEDRLGVNRKSPGVGLRGELTGRVEPFHAADELPGIIKVQGNSS